MRIITYGLSSDKFGGIETFLLNMNKFMSDDCIFDYVIEGDKTIHEEAIRQKGGDILYVASKRKMISSICDWNRILTERKNVDSIVYFNMFSLSWFVPIILCRIKKYQVVIHAHTGNIHNCSFIVKVLHKIGKIIIKFVKSKKITNSYLSSDFLFGKNANADIVYNAIDVDRFSFDSDVRDEVRTELGVENDTKLIGFVGRFAYEKNPLFVIDIFNEVHKKNKETMLVMIGAGEMITDIKKRISCYSLQDCVLLLGNHTDVERYFQAMDFLLLPSLFEGLGIVLVEAQAAGVPCATSADVVPQIAKITDLLEYISLNNSAEKWAEAIINKSNKKNDRKHYAQQVKNSSFDINKEAKKLEEIFKTYAISDKYRNS